MRFLFKVLLALGLAIPLAAAVTLYLAIEREPMVRRPAEVTAANVKRAKQLVEQITPRRSQPSAGQALILSQQDLDLVVNYLAYYYANGSARLILRNDKAEIAASLRPPRIPVIFYFNVTAVLTKDAPMPRFEQINVGRVLIPGPIADWLVLRALKHALGRESYDAVAHTIKEIDFRPGQLAIVYNRSAKPYETLQSATISAADQERLRAYQERLALISSGTSAKEVSLTELLVALFELATARAKQGDPAAENRAAILVLAFHVNGKPLAAFLPAAKDWPPPSEQTVTLNGRDDFAKHFITSAAMATKAGGPLSDAVGVSKELEDSRSGSGFSFADIAANRAGTRFGVNAADRARALQVQQRLAAGVGESELMPATADLPEKMAEAEFKRRFGGAGTPEYNRMIGEID
ncbi:MAG TPA: hypothetical protein VLA17_09910, partial [Candidatus Limnocylindria bacterium]|nr:hypothetical protein [Candidatus Limnocylindria bacterium]